MRDALEGFDETKAAHTGLLRDCFSDSENPEHRHRFKVTEAAIRIYRAAYDRWFQSLSGAHTQLVRSTDRLIVGLGIESILETGLRLHHTYGVPIVPGSALKGLCSAYCDQVWREADARFAAGGDFHVLLFGRNDDAGHIGFEDAWLHPDDFMTCFVADVMTPHQPGYYGGTRAPSDTENPIPVPFLSVSGRFLLAFRSFSTGQSAGAWESLACELALQALGEWGIGGKTSSGYGRLKRVE